MRGKRREVVMLGQTVAAATIKNIRTKSLRENTKIASKRKISV